VAETQWWGVARATLESPTYANGYYADRDICRQKSHITFVAALPSQYLSQELTRPLPLTSGGLLYTVRDAWAYITALPEHREMRQHWQRTSALLLAQADVFHFSQQLELALFQDGQLDAGKTKTHFAYRIDRWDHNGNNILDHIAGVDDRSVAVAAYEVACKRWPYARITLRHGAAFIGDSGKR
jgi:hypothetical protein